MNKKLELIMNRKRTTVIVIVIAIVIVQEPNPGTNHMPPPTCWTKLECRPRNIAMGVFYGPQEKKNTEKVADFYSNLETQINQLNQSNGIIGGDFNAKLELTHTTGIQILKRNDKLLKQCLITQD